MKILLDDGFQIKKGTGIGKYSYYLYKHLKNNNVEVDLFEMEKLSGKINNRLKYLKYINSNDYIKFTEKYDIIIYTNYCMPTKKNKHSKYVVCIPDMVSYLYPNTLPLLYRWYNRKSIRNSLKKADMVMTISESVLKEIINFFPKYSKKIKYTWLGIYDELKNMVVSDSYVNDKLNVIKDNDKFFLFVSTVEKRKNVDFVIDAFEHFCEKRDDYKLIIVGRPGFGYDQILENANRKKCRGNIIFTGYTNDSDVIRLYNNASAFIFPTTYEGFGFAQIECMVSKLPIIESDIPTNREISREYGIYFDLNNNNSLVEKMEMISNNKVDLDKLYNLAEHYLIDFDWDKIAKQYISLFNDLLKLS